MTQHYTRSTTAVRHWCPTCRKFTMHRVDDRRLGPCTEPHREGITKKQEKDQERREQERQQPSLELS